MGVLLKVVAVIFWVVSIFLVYAVINAVASTAGARVGVAIGYVAGAIILSALGGWLWRRPGKATTRNIAA